MTALENKILDALKTEKERLADYDKMLQGMYDDHMRQAAMQTSDYWKKDYERCAKHDLSFQKHGYNFLTDWKNVIAEAMYGKVYSEWHPAQAGKYKGTGHGAYITTELTDKEAENIDKVFNAIVRRGYMKLSKSGKMATFTK